MPQNESSTWGDLYDKAKDQVKDWGWDVLGNIPPAGDGTADFSTRVNKNSFDGYTYNPENGNWYRQTPETSGYGRWLGGAERLGQ